MPIIILVPIRGNKITIEVIVKTIKSIIFQTKHEPELIDIMNRFAGLSYLSVTTAIKQFLMKKLPAEIKRLEADKQKLQTEAKTA